MPLPMRVGIAIIVCNDDPFPIIRIVNSRFFGKMAVEEYATKKKKPLNRKVEISEQLADFEQTEDYWLEPAFAGSRAIYFVAKTLENSC